MYTASGQANLETPVLIQALKLSSMGPEQYLWNLGAAGMGSDYAAGAGAECLVGVRAFVAECHTSVCLRKGTSKLYNQYLRGQIIKCTWSAVGGRECCNNGWKVKGLNPIDVNIIIE